MKCPKCKSPFEDVEFANITIQRCTRCRGLWFEGATHEYIKSLKGSEEIDSGDPEIGRDFNEINAILCPHCSAPMIRMVVPDQHHIWYESCADCEGAFFDAGEFRDYREKTVIDVIRGLFAPERR